jgi:UDP-glucose 4-epimerase
LGVPHPLDLDILDSPTPGQLVSIRGYFVHDFGSLQNATVLVTGGAGFIGSHLVDGLLAVGVREVRVVDNLVNGHRENLAEALADPRTTFVEADIRDGAAMAAVLDGVDVVFHLACLGVRHSLHDPLENHAVNAEGTLLLLQAVLGTQVRRFVHVSSSEVFGTAQTVPMNERHPTWPETVYGGAKLAGEAYARAHYRTYGLPVVVARPFNTYGPRSHFEGDSGEVIPRTIVRSLCGEPAIVFGDGEQTRDFMHVWDTARGLLALAVCEEAVGQTVNLGSGSETTVNDLVTAIHWAVGPKSGGLLRLEDRPGDVRRLLVDDTLMHALTGFRPEVRLDAGIAELVRWFAGRPQSPQQMLAAIEDRNWVR